MITDIRKKVFTEVARMAYAGQGYECANDLPYKIVPGDRPLHRESVFLERAIAGERVRLAMGLGLRPADGRHLVTEGMDQAAIAEQVKERSRVYSKIAHCKDESLLPDLLKCRDSLTESIAVLRKDLKNAKAVMERSEAIAEKLRTAETPEVTKHKEHNRYGR